jgi:hypothetical protein
MGNTRNSVTVKQELDMTSVLRTNEPLDELKKRTRASPSSKDRTFRGVVPGCFHPFPFIVFSWTDFRSEASPSFSGNSFAS